MARNVFWLDQNQNDNFDYPEERVIRADYITNTRIYYFSRSSNPNYSTPGIETDQTGNNWEAIHKLMGTERDEPVSSHFEYTLNKVNGPM